jgi:hypothetical protein
MQIHGNTTPVTIWVWCSWVQVRVEKIIYKGNPCHALTGTGSSVIGREAWYCPVLVLVPLPSFVPLPFLIIAPLLIIHLLLLSSLSLVFVPWPCHLLHGPVIVTIVILASWPFHYLCCFPFPPHEQLLVAEIEGAVCGLVLSVTIASLFHCHCCWFPFLGYPPREQRLAAVVGMCHQ